MKIVITITSLFAIFSGCAAFADSTCRGVDLRRPDLNRPKSQVFIDADNKDTDTGFCVSFSLALLYSQQVGVSISPIDYVFQNALIWQSDREPLGFCGQKAVDTYLGKESNDFVQAFSNLVHHLNPNAKVSYNGLIEMSDSEKQKIGQWLGNICGERIPRPSLEFKMIDLKPKGSFPESNKLMSASEMGAEIDRMLDKGQFVSYNHAFHRVTIVGRTEDCRYIIQDSISESAWNNDGGLKISLSSPEDQAQITFENQFFQYWPRAILLKNVNRIEYVQTTGR